MHILGCPDTNCGDSLLFILATTCFCEHPNENAPANGIMCGDPSKGNYQRNGYCASEERCTGPGFPSQGVNPTNAQEALCEAGRSIHL